MPQCKCGCGVEVSEGKTWVDGGHAARWRKDHPNASKSIESQDTRNEENPAPPSSILSTQEIQPSKKDSITKKYILISLPILALGILTLIFKNTYLLTLFILSIIIFGVWIRSKKTNTTIPEKLLSTQQIKDMRIDALQLTDIQKFHRFFGNLPKWTARKPGRLASWIIKTNNPNTIIKHCVFVDEAGEDKEAWIPYNKELGLLQSDTDFYDIPIKAGQTIWLDPAKFAPLVNRKQYKDEFDVPEDMANALINTGIGYGQLKGFKDLIAEFKNTKTVMWGCVIAVIILGLMLFLSVYSENKAIHALSDSVTNLSKAVKP